METPGRGGSDRHQLHTTTTLNTVRTSQPDGQQARSHPPPPAPIFTIYGALLFNTVQNTNGPRGRKQVQMISSVPGLIRMSD